MREFGNSEVPRVPVPQPRNPWGCPTAEWRGRQMVGLLATLERCGAGRSWKGSPLLWEGLCPAEQRRGRVLGTAYRMAAESRE